MRVNVLRLRLRLRLRLLFGIHVLRLETVRIRPVRSRRGLINLLELLRVGLLGIWLLDVGLLRLLGLMGLHLDLLCRSLARCHDWKRTLERRGMEAGFAVTV